MLGLFRNIIDHYYAVYVLLGVMGFIGLPDIYSYIICLVAFCLLLSNIAKPMTWNGMDILVVIFILYQLISCAFSSYSLVIWYYGVKAQVVPIMFYFIGRNMLYADNKMLNNMKTPMMIAMVFGLLLYFWAPDWYIARRTESLTADASELSFYERTRLSSFWPWSYTMGYGSLFFIMYYFKDFFKEKISMYTYFCIVVAILVLFFAQQRVSIAFFLLYVLFFTMFSKYSYKKRLIYLWIFVGVLIIGIAFYILNYAETSYVEYLMNRSVESDQNIVEERIGLYSEMWKVTVFGDGLGRYGHAVLTFNMRSITDCEYIRLMCELGVCGYLILTLIFVRAIWRAFMHREYFMFELCVLLFMLLAMIGATPLENYPMQPFLLWYCIGRIFNAKLLTTPPLCDKLRKLLNLFLQRLLYREIKLCLA